MRSHTVHVYVFFRVCACVCVCVCMIADHNCSALDCLCAWTQIRLDRLDLIRLE